MTGGKEVPERRSSAFPATPAGPVRPGSALVSGIRWGTLLVALVACAVRGAATGRTLLWAVILVAHAIWRTRRREDLAQSPSSSLVLIELCVNLLAVATTGTWGSPFVFCLATPVIAAGFEQGLAYSLRAAVTIVVAIGLEAMLVVAPGAALQATGQWSIELLLVALLASHARRMFGEAEERHSLALNRMSQLSEANDLLVSLHRLAQSLPATLNLEDVFASTLGRLHAMIDCDVAAVIMFDDATSTWNVIGEGTRLKGPLAEHDLPTPLLAASQSSVASLVVVLEPGEGVGVDLLSRSGLYAPLRARGALVGLVALEHHEPGRYSRRELRLLDGFIETAALAIDNARWFARIRSMGADEERVRIARDMHDRVGQSLATLAFKLDRMTKHAQGNPLEGDINQLRIEVRGVLSDVRATLSDLRTDVSDVRGLAETLEAFLDRVGPRARLKVSFVRDEAWRLPLVQERELWRIAHEAITNVERHAGARSLDVRWHADGLEAVLVVADDGHGFTTGGAGRDDSFGVMGMKERADAIGATLDIASGPGGTTVTCHLAAVGTPAKPTNRCPRGRASSAVLSTGKGPLATP